MTSNEKDVVMTYCKKCVMPNTRPGSIFDEKGICQACRNYEGQGIIDWGARSQTRLESDGGLYYLHGLQTETVLGHS